MQMKFESPLSCLNELNITMCKQLCIYCQSAIADTRDHVPPKSVFPKPRPDNLITVPACRECNARTQEDDEDFRTYITAISTRETGPIIEYLSETTMRGLDRRPAYLADWKDRRMRVSELEDENGHATQKLQVWREPTRLMRVIFRTVRGLHYHKLGKPLPVNCPMHMIDSELQHPELEPGTSLGNNLGGVLTRVEGTEPIVDYRDAFSCRRTTVEGNESAAVWLLTFLKRHWFLVFVNVSDAQP
jgi:hypothetical protein